MIPAAAPSHPIGLTRTDLVELRLAGIALRQLRDPAVERAVPYLLVLVFHDGWTRPNHAPLDGGIASVRWPGWNQFAPPLGRRCRCSLIALTRIDAERRLAAGGKYFDLTKTIPEGAGPDAGWIRADGWWENGGDPGPVEWSELGREA